MRERPQRILAKAATVQPAAVTVRAERGRV
jgi:hypothetical protein